MKNDMGKTRKVDDPYEIWQSSDKSWEWRVLKFYKAKENTLKDEYGRVFCAVKSPCTIGMRSGYEYGDTYYAEIIQNATQVK